MLDWPAREATLLGRGTSYAVVGTAHAGAYEVTLAATEDAARASAAEMRSRGLRRVRIYPPRSNPSPMDAELDKLGERYEVLQRQMTELRGQMRSAAIKAIEAGASETSVAKRLQVDRMTIRYWRDKR